MKNILIAVGAFLVGAVVTFFVAGGSSNSGGTTGITPKQLTDAVHIVLESDRTVYTKQIVNRLAKEEKVIKASEHWKDEKALLLSAQMFRAGAELYFTRPQLELFSPL